MQHAPGGMQKTAHRRSTLRRVLASLTIGFTSAVVGFSHPPVQLAAAASPLSFSGTSQLTYTLADLAPKSAAGVLGRRRVDSTWSVADPTHWRLDSHTQAPALQRHHETLLANGTSLIWYKSIFNRAWRMPLGSSASLATLGMFQGGSLVSILQGMGRQYFSSMEQHGQHDRLLRQEQVLGRTADVHEIWPLVRVNSKGYGRALVWLDQQSPLVLRLETLGLSRLNDEPHHWLYRVTSLTIGQGPSAAALAYHPPVMPRRPPSDSSSTGSGSAGAHAAWQVPPGFIAAGAPAGYVLDGSGEGSDPMWEGPSAAQALFTSAAGFVYIQQQVRVGGLPAALTAGTSRLAGRCQVWTGQYPGGQFHWLALQRGKVSLLAVSDSMSEAKLTRYAAHQICR